MAGAEPADLTARSCALEPAAPEEEVASPIDPQVSALTDQLKEQSLKPVQHRVLRQRWTRSDEH